MNREFCFSKICSPHQNESYAMSIAEINQVVKERQNFGHCSPTEQMFGKMFQLEQIVLKMF